MNINKFDIYEIIDPDLYRGDVLEQLKNLYSEDQITIAYNRAIDEMRTLENKNICNLNWYIKKVKSLLSNDDFINHIREIENIDIITKYNYQYQGDLYDLLAEKIGNFQNEKKSILQGLNNKDIIDILIAYLKKNGFDDIKNPNNTNKKN